MASSGDDQQRRERMTAAVVEQQVTRRENDQLLSLQSELAEARRQNTQLTTKGVDVDLVLR